MTPRGPRAAVLWGIAVVPAVLAPVLLLVAGNPRYLFYGDTQAAYLGWQYRLGEQLRAGHWSLLDPHAWQAGNMVAEGQAGLFSPLAMLIGLLSTVSSDVLVFTALTKMFLLCVGATGVFVLARSYRATAPLAFVAAVAAPLGGMTQYLDLPSWLAGLTIWALLPWVWWGIRRTMLVDANPLPALVLGYLLVTVGYVYGTIMLILVLVACLIECGVARDRVARLRVLGIGVVCGLVALTVYLPGVLTAPVTIRGSGFAMSGKFDAGPLSVLASILPTVAEFGGTLHVLPYSYAAWFLPVLLWLDVDRLRRGWRPVAGLLAMTAVMLLVVVGPARLGPLRWPLRLQPFLVQVAVVLCAALVSRYVVRRPSPGRLAGSLLWVACAAAVGLVRSPEEWWSLALGAAVVAIGVTLLWLLARGPRTGARVGLAAAVAVAFSLVATVLQHGYFPEPPSPERHLPARSDDYRKPLGQARGDVLVVGDVDSLVQDDASAVGDLLDGSAWYLNPHPVQNTYTTIGFRDFRDRYPFSYDGSTLPGVLDTLFTREPSTGVRRVDLLAVSTLLLVRASFPPARLEAPPPPGWRVAESTAYAVTWVRRVPVPGAGRPVWTSAGTSVSLRSTSDRETRFVVDQVPAQGGRVVLSALDWPGYRTDTGSLGAPVDGYLVTVRLPADAAGRTVTVRYSPPAWPVEVASWWLAVTVGLVWAIISAARSRASRRGRWRAPHGVSGGVRTTRG